MSLIYWKHLEASGNIWKQDPCRAAQAQAGRAVLQRPLQKVGPLAASAACWFWHKGRPPHPEMLKTWRCVMLKIHARGKLWQRAGQFIPRLETLVGTLVETICVLCSFEIHTPRCEQTNKRVHIWVESCLQCWSCWSGIARWDHANSLRLY